MWPHGSRGGYDLRCGRGRNRGARRQALGAKSWSGIMGWPRRDHGAFPECKWRFHCRAASRHHTRGNWLRFDRSVHGLELVDIGLIDPRNWHRPSAETIARNTDDGVRDVDVLVHGDVGDVDRGVSVDHDVVDDARSAPAAPPRHADESPPTPPGNDRLAPADWRPADRAPHADRNAA